MELERLALQEVDPLGRIRPGGGEDLGLHLGNVVFEAVDDRLVVVDDPVEDRVEDGARPALEKLRAFLEAAAHLGKAARRPVPYRDDEGFAHEKEDLAEVDLLGVLLVPGGLEDDEERVVEHVELGTLVRLDGVLDGQLVEAELLPDRSELLLRRLVKADPDEVPRLARRFERVGDGQPAFAPDPVLVNRAVDDHRVTPPRSRNQTSEHLRVPYQSASGGG
jgi:hypothetical protein